MKQVSPLKRGGTGLVVRVWLPAPAAAGPPGRTAAVVVGAARLAVEGGGDARRLVATASAAVL